LISKDKLYVFYDGDCSFCNFWVQWILKRDKKDQFLFASLQGNFGQSFLKERNLENKNFSTIYLWKPNYYYLQKSDAALKIAETIGGIYYFTKIFKLIPKFIRNWCYDLISKNRQKLINSSCILLNEEQRKKIID
jgi:predicted DCC family thiol-disulfide oxidoreductase YuxK